MIRSITLALALLALSGAACASTLITLNPVTCGMQRSCAPTTDTGDVVQFNASYGNFVVLTLNGATVYRSASQVYAGEFDQLQLQDANGAVALLSATFSTSRVCTHSGRGQTCRQVYNLRGGTLLVP